MCSHGTPMFTTSPVTNSTPRYGNNSALHCRDNHISWLDWSCWRKNREISPDFSPYDRHSKVSSVIQGDGSFSTSFPPVGVHGTGLEDETAAIPAIGIAHAGNTTTAPEGCAHLARPATWEPLSPSFCQNFPGFLLEPAHR